MQKLKCTLAYDGSNFSGFQIQPKKRTVQGEIEKALKKIHKGQDIRIHSAGRTDTGVHAMAQVFHFETDLQIEPANWKKAFTTLLPNDIEVKQIENADIHFHARFDAVEKEYRYIVLNSEEQDLFKRNYMYYSAEKYDMMAMRDACKAFEGTHDFTSFSSARSTVKGSKIRTLYEVNCERIGNEIHFIIRGNGFLQHMVRIIVGALLDVGLGEWTVNDIKNAMEQRDRTVAGMTIPPQGLYLWQVKYD